MVEQQTPNLRVVGSNPSWPAIVCVSVTSKVSVCVNILVFFKEVRGEIAKIEWPSFDEWVGSTLIVLFIVVLFSLYFFGVDGFLSSLAQKIFAYSA